MAADLAGKVGVYGIDGTLAYTGLVKTANILKSWSVTQTQREAQLERQGLIIGKAADLKARQASASFVVYSSDTTPTLAEAKALVVLPPTLGTITIDDYDISIFDGSWTAVGQWTASPREDGYLEISGTMEQVWNGSAFVDYATVAAAA
jgi:hypothetical protein